MCYTINIILVEKHIGLVDCEESREGMDNGDPVPGGVWYE